MRPLGDKCARLCGDCRCDNQILALELLAIVVGLATWGKAYAGHTVLVWTDNTGGEHALSKGRARAVDHNLLVHFTWLMAWKYDIGLWIERMGTKGNIADLPSREEYGLLRGIGANQVKARIPACVYNPMQWASVCLDDTLPERV